MQIPSVEEMLKAGMHFGHRTSKWHPKMAPFIFGARSGVHIIDLQQTEKLFAEAMAFITKLVAENKSVLLVGTKDQVRGKLEEAAQAAGMPYVKNRWIGGTLTNFAVIKHMIRKYLDLKEKQETGKLAKYTKKEQLDFSKEIEKLNTMIGGIATLKKLPDAIFIWDIKHEKTALAEANKKGIPVIAICDTNVNPENVKYVIPANDDATKAVGLVLDTIVAAVAEGRTQAAQTKQEAADKKTTAAE